MSNYWKAIELALQQNYSVNTITGQIFGPRRQLKVKRAGKQQYPTVRLHIVGLPHDAYSVPAHKVLAFALWGWKAFENAVCVRHLNGDTEDNRAINLALGSYSDNELDKAASLRHRIAKLGRAAQGHFPKNTVLSLEEVSSIKELLASNVNENGRVKRGVVKNLAILHNVHPSTISLIGKGKSWQKY